VESNATLSSRSHMLGKMMFFFVLEQLMVCIDHLSIDYGIVIIHLPDIINCYI